MPFPLRVFVLTLILCLGVSAQTAQSKKTKPAADDADAEATQQRTVAISLVTSLAEEARSFKDQTRRARVQARAADVLWDTDPERARELFRRAWEAAETVDADAAKKRAEEMKRMESEGGPVVIRAGRTCAVKSCVSSPGAIANSAKSFSKHSTTRRKKNGVKLPQRSAATIPALDSARHSACNSRDVSSKTVRSNAPSNSPRPHSTPSAPIPSSFSQLYAKGTHNSPIPLTQACLRSQHAIRFPTPTRFQVCRHISSHHFCTLLSSEAAAPIKAGNADRRLRPKSMPRCATTFSKSHTRS